MVEKSVLSLGHELEKSPCYIIHKQILHHRCKLWSMQCLRHWRGVKDFLNTEKAQKSNLTLSSVPCWYYLHESTQNKATLVSETLLHEALSKLTDLVVNLSVFNNQFLIMKCSLILGNHKM